MAVVGRSPGEGRGYRTYTRLKVPPKSKQTGFLAGDIHGLDCHVLGATKPCLKALIGPDATCPLCNPLKPNPVAWRGYVPLRSSSGQPVTVIITEQVIDVAAKLKPSARVMWGRDDDEFASVWVIDYPQGPEWSRWWPGTKAEDDMAPWLCVLWGMPEILPYVRAHFRGEVKTSRAQPAPIPAVLTDPATPNWVQGVADKLCEKELGQSLAEVFERRGLPAAPGPNGKKKH